MSTWSRPPGSVAACAGGTTCTAACPDQGWSGPRRGTWPRRASPGCRRRDTRGCWSDGWSSGTCLRMLASPSAGSCAGDQFLGCLAASGCLLVTSVDDASPRVLTEALALDRPVVVNRDILEDGSTSMLIRAASSPAPTMSSTRWPMCFPPQHRPVTGSADSYGLVRAGRRLRDFVNGLGGDLRGPHVTLGSVPHFDDLGGARGFRRAGN